MQKVFFTLAFALLCIFSLGQTTQKGSAVNAFDGKLKIGTYDSRAVAYAYTVSDMFKEYQERISKERNEIMESKDTAKWKETMSKVCTEQYLIHQRVFATGSVATILRKIETQLPAIAESSGVDVIVSKWELTWSHPNASIADLTDSIAQLFTPLDKLGKVYGEIKRADKMDVDDFDVGEVIEIWNEFEAKYLENKK